MSDSAVISVIIFHNHFSNCALQVGLGAVQNQRALVSFLTISPVASFYPLSSRIKTGHKFWPIVRQLDRTLEVGTVPETPSPGPSALLQGALPLVLGSLPSLMLLPPPPLGSLSSGKGSQGRGLRQMQTLGSNLSSSWRRRELARRWEDGVQGPLSRSPGRHPSVLHGIFLKLWFVKLPVPGKVESTLNYTQRRALL